MNSNVIKGFKATGDLVRVSANDIVDVTVDKAGNLTFVTEAAKAVADANPWKAIPSTSELYVDKAGNAITMGGELLKYAGKIAPKVGIAILAVGVVYVTYKAVKYFSRKSNTQI